MLGCVLYAVLIRRFFRQGGSEYPADPLVRKLAKTLLATIPVASIAWVRQTWLSTETAFLPLAAKAVAVIAAAVLAYALCSSC